MNVFISYDDDDNDEMLLPNAGTMKSAYLSQPAITCSKLTEA